MNLNNQLNFFATLSILIWLTRPASIAKAFFAHLLYTVENEKLTAKKMAAEDKIPNFLKDFIDWNIFDPDLDCTKAAENY